MTTFATPPTHRRSQLSWSASELQRRGGFCKPLPNDVAAEFVAFAASAPALTADDFLWDPAVLPRMAAFGAAMRQQLTNGDGLCHVRGIDQLGLGEDHVRCLFVAFGCALGDPMLQYGRLYPVFDRGANYTTQGVPVSMTNANTCFHTDSSSVDVVPDFVGLLCEEPSERGGDSLVSNALRVFEVLQREEPEVLALLEQPLLRDVVTPGREKTIENLLRNRFAVFAPSEGPGGVLFRYMRYWLEVGQQKAGLPIDAATRQALDRLDQLLKLPEHVVTFRLERGDLFWVNNRVLAHNRTSYEDTPGNTRRLQRMWIQAPAG